MGSNEKVVIIVGAKNRAVTVDKSRIASRGSEDESSPPKKVTLPLKMVRPFLPFSNIFFFRICSNFSPHIFLLYKKCFQQ